MLGFLLVGVGVYAILDKWSSGEGFKLENVFDVIFNLGRYSINILVYWCNLLGKLWCIFLSLWIILHTVLSS